MAAEGVWGELVPQRPSLPPLRRACYVWAVIRFVTGLCLTALLCSWAPHVHPASAGSEHGHAREAHAEGAHGTSIASDDAHEEHSSRALGEGPECVFCRSSEERESDRSVDTMLAVVLEPRLRRARDAGIGFPGTPEVGWQSTRAPPIG